MGVFSAGTFPSAGVDRPAHKHEPLSKICDAIRYNSFLKWARQIGNSSTSSRYLELASGTAAGVSIIYMVGNRKSLSSHHQPLSPLALPRLSGSLTLVSSSLPPSYRRQLHLQHHYHLLTLTHSQPHTKSPRKSPRYSSVHSRAAINIPTRTRTSMHNRRMIRCTYTLRSRRAYLHLSHILCRSSPVHT